MRTVMVMPIAAYKVLRFLCDVGSPEYRLLGTAFIVRNSGTEQVRLFCDDPADAQSLLDFASRKCPQVVSRIKLRADPSY
jgi:hypothetical protein